MTNDSKYQISNNKIILIRFQRRNIHSYIDRISGYLKLCKDTDNIITPDC